MTLPSDPTIPGLSELIERVERAEGPDRLIDVLIQAAVEGNDRLSQFMLRDASPLDWSPGDDFPAYTSSLDAIVGLIERELPGYCWSVKHGIGFGAVVWSLEKDYDENYPPAFSTQYGARRSPSALRFCEPCRRPNDS